MELKDIRLSYGFTQETIAKLLSINRSTYAHYETGRRPLPASVEHRVNRLFDVNIVEQTKKLRAERLVKKIAGNDAEVIR